ncbi:DUF4446 family protein [uncultured Clostridium sp.]|uniref:DUF4446 family protein n=1 Tax=uncultured Clostridium sp. TaxID=59620 RepID=UPI002618C832|nr:DUF4446 family protein [uncultured Clostridium sp.]
MNNIINLINQNSAYIMIAIAGFAIFELILIIILFAKIGGVKNKFKKMMRGVNNKNLEGMLEDYLKKVETIELNSADAVAKFNRLDENLKNCVQKVAMVRYKAFEDVGSDLSFSIAFLDEKNDGVVLTGIYGRMESTTYAKPIDKGISRYDLSEEELQALSEAMNK